MPGRSDRSYGIQVARLAGLPTAVTARAKEILDGLERDELSRGGRPTLSGAAGDPRSSQLGLFAKPADDLAREPARQQGAIATSHTVGSSRGAALARQLAATELDDTTPRQALALLAELKHLAEEE
jgi:DNA mismatch repair protein MutS